MVGASVLSDPPIGATVVGLAVGCMVGAVGEAVGAAVGDAVGEAVVGDAVSVGPAMVGVAVGAWRVRIKVTPNLLLTSAIRQC